MIILVYMAQPLGTLMPANPVRSEHAAQSTAQLGSKLPMPEFYVTHLYPFGGKRK